MHDFVASAKRVLWDAVELGFLVVLALLVLHMLLGQSAGPYVTSVADNVTKFAGGASGGILGVVLTLGIIWIVLQRGWRARI